MEDLLPQQAGQGRGERQREGPVVGANREREEGPVPGALVDGDVGRPDLEDAREEDGRADVSSADLWKSVDVRSVMLGLEEK